MQVLASSLEDRDGANGACGATADLEWKADEAELTASHKLVEIGKAFHVCDPPFATCEMGLEVGFAFGGWAVPPAQVVEVGLEVEI